MNSQAETLAATANEALRELAERLIHRPNGGYDDIIEWRDAGLESVAALAALVGEKP